MKEIPWTLAQRVQIKQLYEMFSREDIIDETNNTEANEANEANEIEIPIAEVMPI